MSTIPQPSDLDRLCKEKTREQIIALIHLKLDILRNGEPVYSIFSDNVEAVRLLQQNGWIAEINGCGVFFSRINTLRK